MTPNTRINRTVDQNAAVDGWAHHVMLNRIETLENPRENMGHQCDHKKALKIDQSCSVDLGAPLKSGAAVFKQGTAETGIAVRYAAEYHKTKISVP